MRVGIPTWCGRVSPVFDVARHLLLVDVDEGKAVGRIEAHIEEGQLCARVKRVADLGVNTLICGAISESLEAALVSGGVQVIPHTCGPVEQVLCAFLAGTLADDVTLMPGFCGRLHRRQGQRLRHKGGRGREQIHTFEEHRKKE